VPNGTLVLHEFDACELHVEVASVRECGDRIEVSIEASDLCGQCDAYSPAFLALELDTAGKSVHIAQTRTEVPCIDNPPPHQLGRRMLCEQTGGTWNANCGDSACGASQACVLDLPGCDCAADEVFIASGCMPSALCALD
jgi:hypothetical protein